MSSLKEWVIQLRYPYTAGVIAVMWIGTALLAMPAGDLYSGSCDIGSNCYAHLWPIVGFLQGVSKLKKTLG